MRVLMINKHKKKTKLIIKVIFCYFFLQQNSNVACFMGFQRNFHDIFFFVLRKSMINHIEKYYINK